MLTGFEVYGAVGTSIALLNLARQGYKTCSDYRKAGPHMVAAERHCSIIYFNLRAWIKTWGFDVPMTDELYKASWGEDGWKEIEAQLAAVSIKCADLAAIIDKALPSTETYQQISKDERKRIRAYLDQRVPPAKPKLRERIRQAFDHRVPRLSTDSKVEEIRLLEKHISKSTSARRKVEYVLCSGENLEKHLKALEEDFNLLTRLVKSAWRRQHPSVDHRTSTLNERKLVALTAARQFLIEKAKEDRVATKALYKCCSSTKQSLKLELSLIDTTGESQIKRFHIFVPRVQYQEYLEVSTVILRKDPPLGEVDWRDNFMDACDKVHKKEEGLLWLPSDNPNGSAQTLRETRERLWFSLRKRAMHVGGIELSRLSVEIASLVAAERLELAYRIVETGLILLGTSWLSALSNTALRRFKASQQPPRYVLDINERQNLVRTQLWDQKRDLHLYIFTIGVTLVEIALRAIIRELRRSKQGVELFVGGAGDLKWRSLSHITSLVHDEMGTAYSEAVKFCLQDPIHAPNREWKEGVLYDNTRSEEQKSMEILDVFYERVVIK